MLEQEIDGGLTKEVGKMSNSQAAGIVGSENIEKERAEVDAQI